MDFDQVSEVSHILVGYHRISLHRNRRYEQLDLLRRMINGVGKIENQDLAAEQSYYV